MKKSSIWIVAIVVLLAAYFGGTWMTSRMAQAQMVRFTDYVTRESHGLFKVVDTKSTSGFFSSAQDITFSIDYPLAAAILRNEKPLQLTLHNVIQHGPLPGFRTVGIARAESTIVMDEGTRKMIKDVLGTDSPIELSLTFGFLGSTAVHVDSPEMNIKLPGETGTFNWKGMKSRTVFSRHFDTFSTTAAVPGMVIKSKDGSGIEMKALEVKGEFKTAFKSLYVGEGVANIESFDFMPPNSRDVVSFRKAAYGFAMSESGDYYSVSLKMGAKDFMSTPPPLKDVHFDFSINHLHGPTMASMNEYLREFSAKLNPLAAAAMPAAEPLAINPDEAIQPNVAPLETREPPPASPSIDFARIQTDVTTLLKHSPEFVLDHVGFATDKGVLKVTAHVKLLGVTDEDIQRADFNTLLKKLSVTADVNIAQGLIDNWPIPSQQGMKQQILQMEQQGFLKKDGDQLVSHIEYVDGKLVANGKAL